jgi:hypothetical protein
VNAGRPIAVQPHDVLTRNRARFGPTLNLRRSSVP